MLHKGNEMFKQLSKASGAAKHSNPLVVVGCLELLCKGYLKPYYGQFWAQKGKI